MNIAEKLLVGILISVLAWIITNVVMFFIKKYRLSSALIADISYHVLGVKEGKDYFEKLFNNYIKENQAIEYAAYFSKDEYELYKCVQSDLVKYFDKRNLVRIIKFYKGLWELEALSEGLTNDLMKWKEEKRVLNKDDVKFLCRKKIRIIKLCDILTQKEISKIEDLPDDYRGRIEPSTIIA